MASDTVVVGRTATDRIALVSLGADATALDTTEVDAFRMAVETRFGADGARRMARVIEAGRAITHGSVPRDQQPAFETVAKHYAALRGGELVLTQAALSERMSVRQSQGARLKP